MCCITLSCSSLTDRLFFFRFCFVYFYIAVLVKTFDCQSKYSCYNKKKTDKNVYPYFVSKHVLFLLFYNVSADTILRVVILMLGC